MVTVSVTELGRDGGLYYGVNTHQTAGTNYVCIAASEQAIKYFNDRKPCDVSAVKTITGIHQERVPVLFGSFREGDQQKSAEVFRHDLVASSFFFLSDWQIGIPTMTDCHGRIRYDDSIQKLLNIDYPVVNEYALLLGKLLDEAGFKPEAMNWQGFDFALGLTHDIDRLRKKTTGIWVRETVDFLIRNKNNTSLRQRVARWKSSVTDLLTPGDSYQDSILKIIDFADHTSVKPTFFVQSGIQKHPNDSVNYLDYPFFTLMTDRISRCGGEIGFHPGYEAGYDDELFDLELHQLEKKLNLKVKSVRHHYLRYDARKFPAMLSRHSIENDSSIAWAEQAGSRTGCVSPHTVFDRNKNCDTNVLEFSMIAMDVQLLNYMGLNISGSVDLMRKQVDLVERYHGVIVWNYHHHTFDPIDAPGWQQLFGQSLNYAIERKPYHETFKGLAETWFAF
ncbi:MAG: DUF7033 domain-containing protein [Cyclonatronaceae bacterium]